MKIWEPKPPRTLWDTPGLLRDSFTFYCNQLIPTILLSIQLLEDVQSSLLPLLYAS